MRVLLDENMPQRFRRSLVPHEVFTTAYMGWDGKKNGELLALMKSEGFAALVTYDRGLPAQQNLINAGVGVVVIILKKRRYQNLLTLAEQVLRALEFLQPGQVVTVAAAT